MRMGWLGDVLRRAGLTVVEEPGWATRGRHWRFDNPVGAMQHHTAPPVPFPTKKLYGVRTGFRIKANLQSRRSGTIHIIAAGRCNWASGAGSRKVYRETKQSIAPSGTARSRGLFDTMFGNSHYINCEADHLGDGSAMPAVQEQAIVTMWQAIFAHIGWPAERLIGHTEWTRRKIDPLWNGRSNRTPTLRAMMAGEEDDDMFVKRGDKSRQVAYWQLRLLRLDPNALPGFGADGDYGGETAAAVAAAVPTTDGEQIGPFEAEWLDAAVGTEAGVSADDVDMAIDTHADNPDAHHA